MMASRGHGKLPDRVVPDFPWRTSRTARRNRARAMEMRPLFDRCLSVGGPFEKRLVTKIGVRPGIRGASNP